MRGIHYSFMVVMGMSIPLASLASTESGSASEAHLRDWRDFGAQVTSFYGEAPPVYSVGNTPVDKETQRLDGARLENQVLSMGSNVFFHMPMTKMKHRRLMVDRFEEDLVQGTSALQFWMMGSAGRPVTKGSIKIDAETGGVVDTLARQAKTRKELEAQIFEAARSEVFALAEISRRNPGKILG